MSEDGMSAYNIISGMHIKLFILYDVIVITNYYSRLNLFLPKNYI